MSSDLSTVELVITRVMDEREVKLEFGVFVILESSVKCQLYLKPSQSV